MAISDAIASAAMHRRQDGASSTLAASVPLGQRVAAASVGALLTSLATNPLDVVKTRLQVRPCLPHPPPRLTSEWRRLPHTVDPLTSPTNPTHQAQEAPAARAAASASASTSTPSMAIPAGCREYYATMMETVHGAKVPAYTHNSPGGGGGAGSASSAGGASMVSVCASVRRVWELWCGRMPRFLVLMRGCLHNRRGRRSSTRAPGTRSSRYACTIRTRTI